MIEKIKSVKKNPWVLWIWNERRRIKGNKEYNKISDEDFVKQFYKNAFNKDLDLEDQVGKMIMKANMRGGTDNITVACVRFGGE